MLQAGRATAINNQPVGTGAYKFKSYRKDDVVRLLPHEGFWGAPQKTTQLVFAIGRELPAVRVPKMAAGECHLTAPLRDIDIAALDKRREVVIAKTQARSTSATAPA
ncbi:MAG: ABC transporter substrate-binding protein [Comamonadaceae bacterium]|nr:ABC transporter substrate-binding protein [Comamonadaceae bacterium]